MSLRLSLRAVATAVLLLATSAASVLAQSAKAPKPAADLANAHYGPHARHVLDLWKAKSAAPTPLVIYIHGGGFVGGSKDNLSAGLLQKLLDSGLSVMAINYRLSPEVSFPAHFMDCARAIQYARTQAKAWNIDPTRIGATGSSAGAGTSLWLGFHDDMADPANADPVLRQSTRLACMAVSGAQSTYDPRLVRAWVSEITARHGALMIFYGLKPGQQDTPEAYKLYEAASPINYVSKDDPPVYAYYSESRIVPPDAKPGTGVHHIAFGLRLKEKMDALGLECTVRHRDEGARGDEEMVAFFRRHLLGAGK